MEVKALDNVPKILLVSMKAPFHTPRPFVVVVGVFKFRESFLIITDIESAFKYI